MITLGTVDGYNMIYHPHNKMLTFKEQACKLQDLLDAVDSSLDRVIIKNTDLLLIKKQLTYKIGCLELYIEEFNRYRKLIKKQTSND